MENTVLRKREKQLAMALRTLREVAEEIEKLVRQGPAVIDTTDCLEFSAKLRGARAAIMAETIEAEATAKGKRARTAERSSNLIDGLQGMLAKITVPAQKQPS